MPQRRRFWAFALLAGLVAIPVAADDEAGLPLHERIDRLVEAALDASPAAPATDAEFLRRATLDLNGVIPTAEEARAFLDDPSPYKRERLIDRLLADPKYARRLATAFDVMLMERRADAHIPSADWREFLRAAFAVNAPYDQLAHQILAADGSVADPVGRAASKFYLDREAEPNLMVRDIGRAFLGRDLQCAQCHDHPLIDDYKQAHYFGLFAFLDRTYLAGNTLGEKAEGEVSFASVFKKGVTHTTGPRVLDGPELEAVDPPRPAAYWVFPEAGRAIPKQSRRAALPGRLAATEVPDFARNAVNRLWALLMGRGLVHPLDLHSDDNPPSHPEVLDLLAEEFVASGFDVKALLRELARTRTYARSSEPPPGSSDDLLAPERFAVGPLKPLTPEAIGLSLARATGRLDPTEAAVERQLFGVDPKLRDLIALDAERRRLGERLFEMALDARTRGLVAPFVAQFGGAAGQPQDEPQSTVHQALFLANNPLVMNWLDPSGENLTARLLKASDASTLAEELYLTLLSRRPTAEERADVAAFLAEREADRPQAVKELAWALIASAEFRFNH